MSDPQQPFGDAEPAERMPTSVWSGSFRLLGIEVRCHVLDTGERIIEEDSMVALLDAMGNGSPIDMDDLTAFARWQRGRGDA